MKKCLIVSNGYFDNNSTLTQHECIKRSLQEYGYLVDEMKSNQVLALIDGEDIQLKVNDYDFCVYLDKDVLVALMLEKAGIKLFNSADAIRICDDKFLTFIMLSGNKIKMPKTISSPLMYTDNEDKEFLDKVESELGYPVVVKTVYGSMGKGVYLAKDRKGLDELFLKLRRVPHLYQKFISKNSGEDIRIITVGGKVVSAIRRKNANDFRSNVEQGGTGENVELSNEQIFIAEKISKVLNLDYAGIDIIGDNLVCEVNSNAFFSEFEKVTGKDVAKEYAKHIINKISKEDNHD